MKYILIIMILINSNNLFANTAPQVSIEKLVHNSYNNLVAHGFNQRIRFQAREDLKYAYSKNPNEPWLYMLASVLSLIEGYKVGHWYNEESFLPHTVDRAIEFAKRTIELDSKFTRGYVQLAWFYIIKKDYKNANYYLDKAYYLDEKNYYFWLYKGTLSFEQYKYNEANTFYDKALLYAITSYEKNVIQSRKRKIAQKLGNVKEEEKLYIAHIKSNPNSAYSYGNYGSFLLYSKRYDEAVKYLEKAVNIKPYNLALENLKKAKGKLKEK